MARKGRWVSIARACGDKLARTPARLTAPVPPTKFIRKRTSLSGVIPRDCTPSPSSGRGFTPATTQDMNGKPASFARGRIPQISPGGIPVGSLTIAHPPGAQQPGLIINPSTDMAWRPYANLIDGELNNSTPGKVTGWMRFFAAA